MDFKSAELGNESPRCVPLVPDTSRPPPSILIVEDEAFVRLWEPACSPTPVSE
jgi:hypothetical protein